MHTMKKVSIRRAHSLLKFTPLEANFLTGLSRFFRVFKKKFLVFLLTFSLIFSQLFSVFIPNVYAASSPWSQTDWSGGSGQTSWSDNTKFDSSSSVTTSTAGQATLTNTEKLSNTGFETDLTSWSEVPSYTLNDQFTTDRAAGAVNGTSAEPTGGTRTVTDTNNVLSVNGNQLSFATGGVTYGNPGLWYGSTSRTAGKMLSGNVTFNDTGERIMLAFDTNTSSLPNAHGIFQANSSLVAYDNNGVQTNLGSSAGLTLYKMVLILRSTGAYYYIKGGVYTNWTLLWVSSANSTSTLYPNISGYSGNGGQADNIRIPTATWLPTPLAYDTFTRADGPIGSSETTGPDSQTTPSLAWTGGAISTNKNVITPSLGSELITNGDMSSSTGWTVSNPPWSIGSGVATSNGTVGEMSQSVLTIGNWYQNSYTLSRTSGTFLAVFGQQNGLSRTTSGTFLETGRQTSNALARFYSNSYNGTLDDASFKLLTLSSLFSSVSTSDTDVIADAGVTLTSGTQAGVVTNLDSTSSPANFLIAYHDGTNVKLDKNVGGTYTNLISAAATYSAGATLRVITYTSSGSLKVRVYYNNALVGSEQTVSDAGIISNTKHGLFSTYSGNSFDNFTLFARGTGAEYTSAPFEELTVTRDTTTKYAGAASAKLVAGGTDANYLQSVNVGDTNSYNLSAYAYTDGQP